MQDSIEEKAATFTKGFAIKKKNDSKITLKLDRRIWNNEKSI